jgi:hypothetical protein
MKPDRTTGCRDARIAKIVGSGLTPVRQDVPLSIVGSGFSIVGSGFSRTDPDRSKITVRTNGMRSYHFQ